MKKSPRQGMPSRLRWGGAYAQHRSYRLPRQPAAAPDQIPVRLTVYVAAYGPLAFAIFPGWVALHVTRSGEAAIVWSTFGLVASALFLRFVAMRVGSENRLLRFIHECPVRGALITGAVAQVATGAAFFAYVWWVGRTAGVVV